MYARWFGSLRGLWGLGISPILAPVPIVGINVRGRI